MEDNLSIGQRAEDGLGMIQLHYICHTIYFYYYDIAIYNEIIL